MEQFRVNEVSGQIFQPVQNSSGAVWTERGLISSSVYTSPNGACSIHRKAPEYIDGVY